MVALTRLFDWDFVVSHRGATAAYAILGAILNSFAAYTEVSSSSRCFRFLFVGLALVSIVFATVSFLQGPQTRASTYEVFGCLTTYALLLFRSGIFHRISSYCIRCWRNLRGYSGLD